MSIKKTGSYRGKSNKLGGGGRFAQVKDAVMREGYDAKTASAIAAAQGRKSLGKSRFQKLAAAGRKRAK